MEKDNKLYCDLCGCEIIPDKMLYGKSDTSCLCIVCLSYRINTKSKIKPVVKEDNNEQM